MTTTEPRTTRSTDAPAVRLPDFPWDTIAEQRRLAAEHPDGLVNLSVGSPVDEVPAVVVEGLLAGAQAPSYPDTGGTPAARDAAIGWLTRRFGVRTLTGHGDVLPVIGTKELIMLLPTLLGLGSNDTVVVPELAYPTYEAGALLTRSRVLTADEPVGLPDSGVRLVFVNSPGNPTGRVASVAQLRAWVEWARDHDAILVSDECYLEFGWDATPVSTLADEVCGGSLSGVVTAQSLSKRSSMAGYRAGFVAGDPAVVSELLAVRKHVGLMPPAPILSAMTAALADDAHVELQRERYAARRDVLAPALRAAGWRIDHSEAGLYLWATRPGRPAADSVGDLARLGILVAPGTFYGISGAEHVRIALTATDERIAAAAERLGG